MKRIEELYWKEIIALDPTDANLCHLIENIRCPSKEKEIRENLERYRVKKQIRLRHREQIREIKEKFLKWKLDEDDICCLVKNESKEVLEKILKWRVDKEELCCILDNIKFLKKAIKENLSTKIYP